MSRRGPVLLVAAVAALALLALVGLPLAEDDTGYHRFLSPRDPNTLLGAAVGLVVAGAAITARGSSRTAVVLAGLGVALLVAGAAIDPPFADETIPPGVFPPGTQVLNVFSGGGQGNAPLSPYDGNTFAAAGLVALLAGVVTLVGRRRTRG